MFILDVFFPSNANIFTNNHYSVVELRDSSLWLQIIQRQMLIVGPLVAAPVSHRKVRPATVPSLTSTLLLCATSLHKGQTSSCTLELHVKCEVCNSEIWIQFLKISFDLHSLA